MEVVSADLFPRVLRQAFFYWLKLGQAGELPREPCWFLSDDWLQPCRTNHSEAQSFPPPRPRRRVPSWTWSSGANSKQPSPTFRTMLFQWCCPHRIACCPSETLWSRCGSWWPRGLGSTSWDKAYQSQGRQKFVHEDSPPHNLSSSFRLFLNLIGFMSFPLAASSQYPFWLPSHLSSLVHCLSDCPSSPLWPWPGFISLSLVRKCSWRGQFLKPSPFM